MNGLLNYPRDPGHQALAGWAIWMVKDVLLQDVFSVAGQFGDRVIKQFQFDQFFEGEDRGEGLECLDVIALQQKLRKILEFSDEAERTIAESESTKGYLLLLALRELSFHSGSPSKEVSLLSLMINTSIAFALSSTFFTSLLIALMSSPLRSSSMAYSGPPSSWKR